MTPLTELQDFFACAAERAKAIFEATGEVLPMWHAVPAQGQDLVIATPWSDDDEKEATAQAIRQIFDRAQVKRFAFISEAWVASMRPGTSLEEANHTRASQHPDRREVLMINAEDRWGNAISGCFYILRPEHGPAKLSPLQMSDYDTTKGRFAGMLR